MVSVWLNKYIKTFPDYEIVYLIGDNSMYKVFPLPINNNC